MAAATLPFATTGSVSVAVAYAVIAIWYAATPHFFDNAEPSIPAIAWLFHVGLPLYHAADSPERYVHIYGPVAFMLHGWALSLVGPNIHVSKAVGAAAGLGTLALAYLLAREHAMRRRAIALTGTYALLLLMFRHYSFWTRPDPLQVLGVAVSLLLASRGRRYGTAVLMGFAAGIVWNLKFTGPLYTLPAFALLQRRAGWRAASAAAVAAVAMAAVPFVFFSNISFLNYVMWLRTSARTGLLLSTLRQNIEWSLFLSVPLLLAYLRIPSRLRPAAPAWRVVVGALFIGMAGVVVAAAKPGAGPYHLLPFLPVIIYAAAWPLGGVPRSVMRPGAAWAFKVLVGVAMAIAAAQQAQLMTTMGERGALHEVEDIQQFASTHAGVIEMGYGATESLSLERPVLVFRNNSDFLDQPAVREHQLEGLEIPLATTDALAGCRITYWLIPKGEAPFSGRNRYTAVLLRPLFPEQFRDTFTRTHKRVGSTAYYDVWQCQGASAR